uniref:Neuropeptide-like GPCR n=1 Tax=Tripedalia cystophora TaxID=6141 RepID=A0A481ZM47_TRICY|nr:neuropeptide-like GPCR [Tripedalia cystophora]
MDSNKTCDLRTNSNCSIFNLNQAPPLEWVWICLITISVVFNGFTVVATSIQKQARSTVNKFILSLSLSDLFLTLTISFFLYEESQDLSIGKYGPRIKESILHLFHSVLAMNIVAVCFERYYAVCKPLKFNSYRRKVIYIIVSIWIVSALIVSPLLLGCHIHSNGSCEEEICAVYGFSLVAILHLVPTVLLLCIIVPIRSQLWSSAPISHISLRIRNHQTRKITKMIGIVTALSFTLWTPCSLFLILKKFRMSFGSFECIIWSSVYFVSFSHCCLNPIVYMAYNSALWGGLKQLRWRKQTELHYCSDSCLSPRDFKMEKPWKKQRLSTISQSCLQVSEKSPTSLSSCSYLSENELNGKANINTIFSKM